MNSKGFRDEDGNIITIPGSSVRYNPSLNGHLAQFGEDGYIEDGGEKSQFAEASHTHEGYAAANHNHAIADVTGLQTALDKKNEIPVVHFTKASASTTNWTLNNDDETAASYYRLVLGGGAVIVCAEISTDKRYFLGAFVLEDNIVIPSGGGMPVRLGVNIRFYVDGSVYTITHSGAIVPEEISQLGDRTLTKTTDNFEL